VPTVAWRAGLDLDPVDVSDDEQARWLRCLVWPGQPDRERALAAAVAVARSDPPRLTRGDLTRDFPALAAQAPEEATLVVYHSATLAYVDPAGRRAFTAAVRRTKAAWLSVEAPGLVPEEPSSAEAAPAGRRQLVLVRDGRRRLALADGHGAWLRWLV
jgi:hypothetical protein